jgi:hypothetical protein
LNNTTDSENDADDHNRRDDTLMETTRHPAGLLFAGAHTSVGNKTDLSADGGTRVGTEIRRGKGAMLIADAK